MIKVLTILIPILFVVYLLAVCPALRRHPDRVLMRGMYIAHRGLHVKELGVPENSLLAFSSAVKLGFCIEIDIHITADGEVVVFHDDDTARVCGVPGRIEDKTLAELKELRLRGTTQQIPTLQEVLATVDGKVPLLIELKCNHHTTRPLCRAADKILATYAGKYMVQSFYPPALLWYRRHRRNICRGQLAFNFPRHADEEQKLINILAGWLLFNFISRPDFVAYDERDTNSFSRNICTALGALPVGWVFRSEQRLSALKPIYSTYIFEDILPPKPYDEL